MYTGCNVTTNRSLVGKVIIIIISVLRSEIQITKTKPNEYTPLLLLHGVVCKMKIAIFLLILGITTAALAQRRKVYKWPPGDACMKPTSDKLVELACLVQQQEWRMLHFAALGGAIGNEECDRLWDHHKLMHGYLEQYRELWMRTFEIWSGVIREIPFWDDKLEMRLPSELNPACRSP